MGGNALKQLGIESKRMTTSELNQYTQEIKQLVEQKLGVEVYVVQSYREKESHGDADLLLKIDHEFHNKNINLRKFIEETFVDCKGISSNGSVISWEYKDTQIDFIPVKESNWEVSKCFFDWDPTGNLTGKIAHKFGLKYGFEGLKYPFRTFSGVNKVDIVLSKDNRKIFDFLGCDYDLYLKGFNNQKEIFDYIINSKYFNFDCFLIENLNSIDKKRNRKRESYKLFLDYINLNKENLTSYVFNKDKKSYLEYIDSFFPEADLFGQLEELKRKDSLNKECSEKFNGEIIMQHFPNLKGKELGDKISFFKSQFSDYKQFIVNNTQEEIIFQFKSVNNL